MLHSMSETEKDAYLRKIRVQLLTLAMQEKENEIASSYLLMIWKLLTLPPKKIARGRAVADHIDLEQAAAHLQAIAGEIDAFILKRGQEINSNLEAKVDLVDFTNILFGALDGDALCILRRRAENMRLSTS